MPFLKGEDINMGVGREAARGTYQAPSIWIPGRSPSGVTVDVQKTPIKETNGSGMSAQGSFPNLVSMAGDFEHNLRASSIGYFLLSNFGKVVDTTLESGVYQHVFDILTGNPQFPTLSLGLSKLGVQDYKYLKTICKTLQINIPVNDLVTATASFVGASEATVTDYTPSFPTDDYYFRPFDIVIKVADVVANLSAATAMKLKTFSVKSDNNARVNQNISELNPSDVLALMNEVTGSFEIDFMDESQHDLFLTGGYQAMSITMTRSDITIGASHHPSLVLTFPKISYEKYTQNRKMDDIVMDSVDFTANFDAVTGYGARATLVNATDSYAT